LQEGNFVLDLRGGMRVGVVARPFVPPPLPKTPKSAASRERLLYVAAQLFEERGYNAVALLDVATAAGMSKSAVYGHFRSKGELLVEVIRWKLAEGDHSPAFKVASADLDRGLDLIFAEQDRENRLLQVDAAAAARHDADVAAGLAHLYGERLERIRDSMVDFADPETAAWLVAVIVAGIGVMQCVDQPMPDPQRLHDAIRAALCGLMSD
jgi:AcrR family transcriptional regulator